MHSLVAVEASNRTRVVVNLNDSVPYEVSANGNRVTLKINTQGGDVAASRRRRPAAPGGTGTAPPRRLPVRGRGGAPGAGARGAPRAAGGAVRDIDFRRGDGGEGRVDDQAPQCADPGGRARTGRARLRRPL